MAGHADTSEPLYDSAARAGPRDMLRSALEHRELVALLARREITARYRNALLGATWAIITPVTYAAALWAVFSQVAPFATPGLPYIVYVLAGVVVLNFVSQVVIATAGAIAQNTVALRRVRAPVGVFITAHALAAVATLAITTLVLLAVQVFTGLGIPVSAIALPLAFVLLAIAATGFGTLVGALAVLFADALEMTRVVLSLAALLTPVFYPASIVPDRFRFLLDMNPIHHYLVLFRDLAYGGGGPPWTTVAVCVVVSVLAAAAGAYTFARVRRSIPSLI